MIRVYRKEEANGPLLDRKIYRDPVEAEAAYIRLCRTRTDGPGLVRIVPDRGLEDLVPRGAYRTDRDWPQDENGQPWREQERARALIFCARPDQGWTPPAPSMIRGALAVAGLTQTAAARRLGITPRQMRYYCAGDGDIPWAAWCCLLRWAGYEC